MIFSADETADVGIDLGTPVVESIGSEARSRFNGHIPKVTIEVRDASAKADAAVRAAHEEVARRTE
jgi:arylsulfatase